MHCDFAIIVPCMLIYLATTMLTAWKHYNAAELQRLRIEVAPTPAASRGVSQLESDVAGLDINCIQF